jgi:hypothetical protein
MIKGFEKITFELTADELNLITTVITGLVAKKGKANAVTSIKICEAMKIKAPRLRKMISYIRVNDLIFGLCSSSTGYYVAETLEELDECCVSLKQRIAAQVKVLNSLERQRIMFGGDPQTTLFE